MSPTRYAGFTLRTECNHCGMPLPVDRPARTVECSRCHGQVTLPDEVWRTTLYTFEGDDPLPPPPWLQAQVKTVHQLYTVDPRSLGPGEAELITVDVEAPRPVVMACPQCGGSLNITTEHARVTSCQYCSAEVFLPDEVWQRLHPVRTVRWWYVRFEGLTAEKQAALREENRERALREEQQTVARQNAAKAWKLVPFAWMGVFLLCAIHAFLYANYFRALTLPALFGANRLVMVWLGVFFNIVLIGFIGYPTTVAEKSRGWPWASILGAAFCLVPFAGGLLGIISGLIFLLKKPDPEKPGEGVGRPAAAAIAIHGATVIMALILSIIADS